MNEYVECPGCRAVLPNQNLGLDERYNATGECVTLYGELAAYNMTWPDATFIHQLAVDAYAAQHVGASTKPITIVFALVGLCLFNERGFTGRQVQLAHMQLAGRKQEWPFLEPPPRMCDTNVKSVMEADEGERREEMIKRWSADVWRSWEHKHKWVREICQFLD